MRSHTGYFSARELMLSNTYRTSKPELLRINVFVRIQISSYSTGLGGGRDKIFNKLPDDTPGPQTTLNKGHMYNIGVT